MCRPRTPPEIAICLGMRQTWPEVPLQCPPDRTSISGTPTESLTPRLMISKSKSLESVVICCHHRMGMKNYSPRPALCASSAATSDCSLHEPCSICTSNAGHMLMNMLGVICTFANVSDGRLSCESSFSSNDRRFRSASPSLAYGASFLSIDRLCTTALFDAE